MSRLSLEKTPYSVSADAESAIIVRLKDLEERVDLLRHGGLLSAETLKNYYGERRFEQVAESNAIEGSTLSVGETELAVLRGVTITGHDPKFVRDAISLDHALTRIAEIARDRGAVADIASLQEVHSLILGEQRGAGVFRSERVAIRGSAHTPPKTRDEVLNQMEFWQDWSRNNAGLPAPIRSAVLHAWLTHIHPYIDGNGRVSRAIGNLELIRVGYPPIIIKKKERDRYIDALAESDIDGNIASFFELIFDKIEDSLIGLEHSARRMQGFDPALIKIQRAQQQQLDIWTNAVVLLRSIIELRITNIVEMSSGSIHIRSYNPLDLNGFLELCQGRHISNSWAFIITAQIPGLPRLDRLVFAGPRSEALVSYLGGERGPSLFWSIPNPVGFPQWKRANNESPFCVEMTCRMGNGDEWFVRLASGDIRQLKTSMLADQIVDHLIIA